MKKLISLVPTLHLWWQVFPPATAVRRKLLTAHTLLCMGALLYAGTAYAEKVERKEIVVVMPISAQSLSESMRSSLTDSFIGELTRTGKYEVISGKIVADAMTEAFKKQKEKRQQCDEIACIRKVANNFGTDLVLTIKVVKEEDTYFINAKIENITSGSQVSQKDDICEKCKIIELQKKIKILAVRLVGMEAVGETTVLPPPPVVQKPAPAISKQGESVEASKQAAGGEGMVFIKGGCFQMGDTYGDGESDEKPVHEVCVDDFYMGRYEVTQKEWQSIMGNNPSAFKGCDNCPVENVSWNDTQEFIKRLNEGTGRSHAERGNEKGGFRLPTEAEWEYASRSGGRSEKYSGGNNPDSLGWSVGNSGGKTHPGGQKEANGLGLYDMSGNVREWCSDWYDSDYYRKSPKNNPGGASSGQDRVRRGGSWQNGPAGLRTSLRDFGDPRFGSFYLGFRLVRTK